MEIKECREEEDKHKINIGSATNRAYIQSPSNMQFLIFLSTL